MTDITINVTPTRAEAAALKIADITFAQMTNGPLKSQREAFLEGINYAGLAPADRDAAIEALGGLERIMEDFKAGFARERAAFVALLLEVYTEEELLYSVELYNDPRYVKILDKMPVFMGAMREILGRVIARVIPQPR